MIKKYINLKYIVISTIFLLSLFLIIPKITEFFYGLQINTKKCNLVIDSLINNIQENYNGELDYEYIIIGAGPAGLQAAYFLQKYNKKYIIIERSSEIGSFFKKYPIHRKLISINKVNTGKTDKEFNLRHDWNSLLCDDDSLLFKNYSEEFYPKADIMVEYLNDFYNKNKLNVLFNTNVLTINKINDEFHIITDKKKFKCSKLIVSAGMFKPNRLDIEKSISYTELTTDKSKFKNKNIMIIGQGNSGFETADYLTDTAAIIHIFGRGPLKFAWQTHYVGDLRAVNNNFLDTYQLKTQNGMDGIEGRIIFRENDKYFLYDTDEKEYGNQSPPEGYDYVIDCTGFQIDTAIFGNIEPKHNGKVPLVNPNFESENIKNLFFAGVLGQHISYRKSSGAFIHGFRYLIKSMINIQTNNLKMTEYTNDDFNKILDKILYRINNGSAIFQMFGCLIDLLIFKNDKIIYIEEIPFKLFESEYKCCCSKALVISLNYGNFGGVIVNTRTLGNASYVFGEDRATGSQPEVAHLSNFLHPVLKLYKNSLLKRDFHMSEHLLTEFNLKDVHIEPLKKFLKEIL